ncbi:H(+)/Cl(-) exchange transporter ClcA [Acuticoccus sp. MNP-M23]|uniref:H(+)/Cl(-) exchange transporter ClcA n=1 Tax=Acuticoccus sp. MNP-M23 TaxID=3072793 RepID=UPI002815DA2D|nr:H(+)/Cl(-) exchange transporter ClcA [Acuticoccus sp. MNP-M23]WMS44341.1 H(+)/Cl(-) exchange transporter ClcA [Acuticoccus sp. MNP-M23]
MRRFPYIILLAAIVGVVVGLVGTAFHLVADGVLALHRSVAVSQPLAIRVAISASAAALMTLIGVAVVRRFAPEASGSGIPEVEGAMANELPLRWARVLPVKFVSGVMAIGAGLVVGREGPTIHIGAAISQGFARIVKVSEIERRGLIAAGAAAGLSTAFNAPVASVMFVLEETRRQFPNTADTYAGVIVASLGSALVTQSIMGARRLVEVTMHDEVGAQVILALVLGVFLGGVGVVFNRMLVWGLDRFARLTEPRAYALAACFGALAGAMLVVDPNLVQGGETLVTTMTEHAAPGLAVLILLVIARFLVTIASYSIGIAGGIFAPILCMGTAFGLTAAVLVNALPLGMTVDPAVCAVIAMTGLFSATVGAPMVAVIILMELTAGYVYLPELMACSIAATLSARALGGKPIYEVLFARRLDREAAARHSHTAGA